MKHMQHSGYSYSVFAMEGYRAYSNEFVRKANEQWENGVVSSESY